MKLISFIVVSLSVACLGAMLLLHVITRSPQQPTVPLSHAAVQGDAPQIRKLIAQGTDVNARDKDGLTPLMWAARKGHTEIARALVEAGADMNVRDCASAGWTPLMHAIHKNQNDLARLLIERGADVNATAARPQARAKRPRSPTPPRTTTRRSSKPCSLAAQTPTA